MSIGLRNDYATVTQPPARMRRPRWSTVAIVVFLLALAGHGLYRMNISFDRLLRGPSNLWNFFNSAFPPATERAPALASAMLETIEMAVIGTVIGIVLSVPAALLAAANTSPWPPVAVAMRFVLTTLRAIPDLVWALIFVMSVGIGPMAGILAIAVDVLGFAGRFFAERIEEVERGPIDALRSTGAGSLAVMAGAVLPASFASFTATSLYCLEKSIRGATVLGMVGAGGIGGELTTAFTVRAFDTALTIILMILVVVLLAERLSSTVRRRMLGADQLGRSI
ncbi:phosphonate ABC transporter, permease protein PhnE [Ornithinimicrobium pratense]|uniref:Phosphonate ABC transporter, permease protein PhnE n=1 Tax=Ornithinimicrobium pratense TaxID=2593973 RepID=A0A5J6V4J9_9MICO|nr:phosphonate ABC transporter, permease protein PhnE [Ornithinimicrobium pratense]QFG68705.1 phosphonate ABC transporter, permease protein PhnE [Ornithinimicrobium pratense]